MRYKDFVEHLFTKLKQNSESDIYPYHMPGHKRNACGHLPTDYCSMDITEVDGFDNLHQPEGILKALQDKAADIYGAEESFYLINGSTCGILSAVSAVVPAGGHILMARNCHKSAYHAVYLRNLKVSYLYPSNLPEGDICESITANQVAETLNRESDIDAVLIVSPTYEGRIADVKSIAEVVHSKGIPLIVDEAHGAHLGFTEGFAQNSCRLGADLVIHSVHKTLPALTQTALLHVNGALVNREKLKRFLRIYQSSSPSYLLMASIDNALQYVEHEGKQAFADFADKYYKMLDRLADCKYLYFLQDDCGKQDVGKLIIRIPDTISEKYAESRNDETDIAKRPMLTGKQLYDLLLQKYHLQLEMASEYYVLAMFTVNDGDEAYRRMTDALLEIDAQIAEKCSDKCNLSRKDKLLCCEKQNGVVQCDTDCVPISLAHAWDSPMEKILLKNAVGRYAGEFVNLYPPGIPILVPGEIITEDICELIIRSYVQGLNVQGVEISEANIAQSNILESNIPKENMQKSNALKSNMLEANIPRDSDIQCETDCSHMHNEDLNTSQNEGIYIRVLCSE